MSNHITPENISTLILDTTYQPMGFFTARAAIKHLITNRAKAYDKFGNLQDWVGWMHDTAHHHDDNPYMNTCTTRVDVPTIMVINHFFGNKCRVKANGKSTSLKYIYKAYNGVCQYCLSKIPYTQATKDHIYPKSKGGPNCTTNLILACKKCNSLKADVFPYYDKLGNEVKPKTLLPVHHHRLYGPKTIRAEWKFFLHMD